ncbi:gamma-glutamyltransferase [Sneathiella chinensis]|uniref:Gamma-glutamyltranspeptidase n=1 Tax=Sneathiella chinensis TaxID=349750 RepID=A0ABQ5U722_9PROT|nr:gamma-glutamyltransferase [Sneathiella chinensis]GLQ07059.1 hypothetical protein GCM10007924_22800 [Sneathiella chinensis]
MGGLFALAACETAEQPVGVLESVEGPLGGAASDEPRATLVAQDILSSGGSAADAATALYFTLAVTYPIAGSLGGGGECIVYDRQKNELENLQFFAAPPQAGGRIAVPGNMRGFAALHARYGKMDWGALLAPAENFANFGESMSRAQHMAMVTTTDPAGLGDNLKTIYGNGAGAFKDEGAKIRQVRLASVLSRLRTDGGAAFYGGTMARAYLSDVRDAGGTMTSADLFNYKPTWQAARTFNTDAHTVGISSRYYGELYQNLWQGIFDGKGLLQLDTSVSAGQQAEVAARNFGPYARFSPFVSGGATSFVTMDNRGSAVSCVVGVRKPFGVGEAGNITGIVMAPNIPDEQAEFPATPMVVANLPTKTFQYASASSGGAAGVSGAVRTAVGVFGEGRTLEAAISEPRVFTMGQQLPLLYEQKIPADQLLGMTDRHPVMIEVERLGAVNAIHCADGKVFNCQSRSDPRGYGLSMIQK